MFAIPSTRGAVQKRSKLCMLGSIKAVKANSVLIQSPLDHIFLMMAVDAVSTI